jgi:hypothetical protein
MYKLNSNLAFELEISLLELEISLILLEIGTYPQFNSG